MTTYETRQIKGWRTRMDETAAELRERVWRAPAQVIYHEGQAPPSNGDSAGHDRWFHREFGEERALARAELTRFRSIQARVTRSEMTDEQREARNSRQRAKTNAAARAWRARQPDEWRLAQALKKRARRAANPDLYRGIDSRHNELHREVRNARRRAAYARSPEAARAKSNARKAAKRERDRAASHHRTPGAAG
ncbi:hypothetical protein [Acidovorax sp.]|uniref:hypothetical protein n=1 Tax=Acidovorax sp. TaxID=1872122 RepID=UPI003CFE8DD0